MNKQVLSLFFTMFLVTQNICSSYAMPLEKKQELLKIINEAQTRYHSRFLQGLGIILQGKEAPKETGSYLYGKFEKLIQHFTCTATQFQNLKEQIHLIISIEIKKIEFETRYPYCLEKDFQLNESKKAFFCDPVVLEYNSIKMVLLNHYTRLGQILS